MAEMGFPTRMLVGPGALARLPEEMQKLGVSRALVVSDPGLQAAGIVDKVCQVIKDNGHHAEPYLGVSKNPIEKDVLDGVDAYRKADAQFVIALGGGAPMDVAKTIALKVTHDLDLEEYDDLKDGYLKIEDNMPPTVAIPTTAGTGSEVGRASVVCLGEEHRKVVIFSPHMLPKLVIGDAELTTGLPAPITAATGIDALTHAMEAYVAKGEHPFADTFAIGAITRVGLYLKTAVEDGSNLLARHEMLLAASMGAISFQKGLGACHALAHPLGAVANLHHGLANAIMLPHIVRFNMEAAQDRYITIGEALGAEPADTDEGRAEACLKRIEELNREVGIDTSLSKHGVTEEMIEKMVPQALADAAAPCNPRELTEDAVRELYHAAM